MRCIEMVTTSFPRRFEERLREVAGGETIEADCGVATKPRTVDGGATAMKLLLLNYELPPIGGGGGHATYHTALALADRGHDVDILTSRYGGVPGYQHENGVDIHRVPSFRLGVHKCGLRGAASYLVCALPRLRELLHKQSYDLCHYYFSMPTGALSFYSHNVQHLPYLVSLRGSDVPGYDATKAYLRGLHRLLGRVNRGIWNRAGAVIANSNSLRQQALEDDPDAGISVIPNGIDVERFSPRARPGPERAPVRLISVCRLVPRKGVDVLLEAMAMLADLDVTLEIVGTGELEQPLREKARALGLGDRVHFAGFVSQEDLPAHHHAADIFVLPSLAESFAMALLEAMGCGLPVVATCSGGIPEIVTDGENGLLVPAESAVALAAGIRHLVADRDFRLTLGENNARKVRAHYTWARIAEQYEQVYRQVLESRPN